MTREALAALLATLAAMTLGRSWRRSSLRPAALGLLVLAGADIARIWTYQTVPRLDVVLSFAWPVVAAVLVLGRWGLLWLAWALFLARWGAILAPWWSWALQGPRLALGAAVTVVAARRPGLTPGDPGGSSPGGDSRGSRRAATSWPPSELVGLILAAGQVAGVLAGLWTRWGEMRILTAAIYGVIGVVVWRTKM